MPDDIRLQTTILRHYKFRKLRQQLGDEGFIGWLSFTFWVADNRPDGDLTGLVEADIEMIAEWRGKAGSLASVLLSLRLLDGEAGRFQVHEWAEHQPYIADRPERIAKARRAARVRWKRPRPMRGTEFMLLASSEHTTGIPDACAEQGNSTAPAPPFTSIPLTSQKQVAAAAFEAIGHEEPFGQVRFQEKWIRNFESRAPGEWLTIVMERTIQECQNEKIPVPKPFFSAKRGVEGRDDVEFKNAHRGTPL